MLRFNFVSGLNDEDILKLHHSTLWKKVCADYCFLPGSEKYYSEYHQGIYTDRSFVAYLKGEPVLYFPCTQKELSLAWFQFPVSVFYNCNDSLLLDEINRELEKFLERISKEFNFRELSVEFNEFLVGSYFSKISQVTNRHFAVIDLSLSEEKIKSNIRKSYKSLVNWGKNNLEIKITDKLNPDRSRYDEFKNFHIETAGRKTRSDASWDLHYQMIEEGNAYLVSAYYQGKIASNVFVLHGNEEAFYGVGVNDRSLMEQNLAISHYPLLAAAFHAKTMGLKKFNLNEIDKKGIDEKADNISKFKQGFSNTVNLKTAYLIQIKN